jgi:hypothetical protein
MGITFRYHLSGVIFASFFNVERVLPGWSLSSVRQRLRFARPASGGLPPEEFQETAKDSGPRHPSAVAGQGDSRLKPRLAQAPERGLTA